MGKVQVTYLQQFENTNDSIRKYMMHEFAANGAKSLVLSDTLLKQILFRPELKNMVLEEMSSEGLEFADAHAIFGKYLDLNCPVEAARPELIARLKLQLLICASMNIKTITVHVGNEGAYPEYPLEVQFDCIKRSLEELLPFAESLGIIICIENIWTQLNTPERLLTLKELFPVDALGFCYDAGHANLMDKGRFNPESNPFKTWGDVTPQWDDRILEKMLPHVVNCHIHDNNGVTDEHLLPGAGNIDWPHIAKLLARAPRLMAIQSEVIPLRANASVKELCDFFSNFPERYL